MTNPWSSVFSAALKARFRPWLIGGAVAAMAGALVWAYMAGAGNQRARSDKIIASLQDNLARCEAGAEAMGIAVGRQNVAVERAAAEAERVRAEIARIKASRPPQNPIIKELQDAPVTGDVCPVSEVNQRAWKGLE